MYLGKIMRLGSRSGPTKMITSRYVRLWSGLNPCREKKEEKPSAIISMAESFCSEQLIIFYTRYYTQKMHWKKKGSIRTSLLLCICWQTFIFHRNKYLLSPNVLMLLRNISLSSFLETAAAFYVDYKPNLFKPSVIVLESSYFCTLLTLL